MEKVDTIKNLYFNENKTLTDIAKIIDTSISYISRILRNDERYRSEKDRRKQHNLQCRRKKQKDMIYSKRKNIIDVEYAKVREQHEQASIEMSKRGILSKDTLRKWCGSAYIYNPIKRRYEFNNDELLKPADFPKYINV